MGRIMFVVVLAAICVGLAALSFAAEPVSDAGQSTADKGVKMGKEPHHRMGMCPMHMMSMKTMTERSIVATEDGSVVVMVGNRLSKYNKDLELVKEVEMKSDAEDTYKKMQEMKEKCPMCQEMTKMMFGSSEENKASDASKTQPPKN